MSQLVTPKEVVGLLAQHNIIVCEDTVRNWCTRGLANKKSPKLRYRLEAIRIGGRIYILREGLMKWLPLVAGLADGSV
jgi:hypothetical protein